MLKAIELLKKIKEGNFTPYINENLIKIDEAIKELEELEQDLLETSEQLWNS